MNANSNIIELNLAKEQAEKAQSSQNFQLVWEGIMEFLNSIWILNLNPWDIFAAIFFLRDWVTSEKITWLAESWNTLITWLQNKFDTETIRMILENLLDIVLLIPHLVNVSQIWPTPNQKIEDKLLEIKNLAEKNTYFPLILRFIQELEWYEWPDLLKLDGSWKTEEYHNPFWTSGQKEASEIQAILTSIISDDLPGLRLLSWRNSMDELDKIEANLVMNAKKNIWYSIERDPPLMYFIMDYLYISDAEITSWLFTPNQIRAFEKLRGEIWASKNLDYIIKNYSRKLEALWKMEASIIVDDTLCSKIIPLDLFIDLTIKAVNHSFWQERPISNGSVMHWLKNWEIMRLAWWNMSRILSWNYTASYIKVSQDMENWVEHIYAWRMAKIWEPNMSWAFELLDLAIKKWKWNSIISMDSRNFGSWKAIFSLLSMYYPQITICWINPTITMPEVESARWEWLTEAPDIRIMLWKNQKEIWLDKTYYFSRDSIAAYIVANLLWVSVSNLKIEDPKEKSGEFNIRQIKPEWYHPYTFLIENIPWYKLTNEAKRKIYRIKNSSHEKSEVLVPIDSLDGWMIDFLENKDEWPWYTFSWITARMIDWTPWLYATFFRSKENKKAILTDYYHYTDWLLDILRNSSELTQEQAELKKQLIAQDGSILYENLWNIDFKEYQRCIKALLRKWLDTKEDRRMNNSDGKWQDRRFTNIFEHKALMLKVVPIVFWSLLANHHILTNLIKNWEVVDLTGRYVVQNWEVAEREQAAA